MKNETATATARAMKSLRPDSSPDDDFESDVVRGLSAQRKRLPCKHLYDARGAELFDRICELDEYYPTRTELQIMRRHAGEMAAAIGPEAAVVELGSGSALKTRILLDHLPRPAAYVPVDISPEQLEAVAHRLRTEYPALEVSPVRADFTSRVDLPRLACTPRRRLVYFPGSTIGNFQPAEAARLLTGIRHLAGPGGSLLIGVDLKKDPAVLHAAYNDAAGVTAAFNLNLIHRINRELDGTFDVSGFDHYAYYNPRHGRIEMHLVSREGQTVTAAGRSFTFEPGESILTECSYKHGPTGLAPLAARQGLRLRRTWTDDRRWFCVQLFDVI